MYINRILKIHSNSPHSFFLWGSRQTGKTTYLRQCMPDAFYIDLLDSQNFREFTENPSKLSEVVDANPGKRILIDEIQKVPELLDEVQRLIVFKQRVFGLCGSSARKLKRGHANLLGGRALRFEMFGLVSHELKDHFDLLKNINRGNIPSHYFSEDFLFLLRAYVGDYLKEEIAAEGIVRNLPAFSNFLSLASLGDSEIISYSTFARDVGVSVNTVKEYFQILVDTLLARFVPSYVKQAKRRVVQSPKFYFDNVGIVNFLAKRSNILPKSEAFGKAFENILSHELHAYSSYSEKYFEIFYWRLSSGTEVDFILEDMQIAIEAKGSDRIHSDHLKNLRTLKQEHPKVSRTIVVCLEKNLRITEDGIEIMPIQLFLKQLWCGEII